MDASLHYPYDLLKLGEVISAIYHNKYPEILRKKSRPPSLACLKEQLEAQYAVAEQAVISSCAQSPLCREMFRVQKMFTPRRTTVFVLAMICFWDFMGGTYAPVGFTAKVVGCSLDDDEIRGAIMAREEIGNLLSEGKAIGLNEDDQLHTSPDFRYYFSLASKSHEIGLRHDEWKQYVDQHGYVPAKKPSPQRPLRRLNGRWQTQKRFNWKPGDSGLN